jgi:hypothetical protein
MTQYNISRSVLITLLSILNGKIIHITTHHGVMTVMDKQMRMRYQAELSYFTQRLEQIRQNRDMFSVNKEEYELYLHKIKEITSQLY